MRIGPACATPCDDCRITSRKFARAGVQLDPDQFYDDPLKGTDIPMRIRTLETLRQKVNAAQTLPLFTVDISTGEAGRLVEDVDALLTRHGRAVDAFERLAAAITALDFDATESAVPETQEHWLEWVRDIHDRAAKVLAQTGDLT